MKKSIKLIALFVAITFVTNSFASELGIKMSNLNLVNYKPASKDKSSSGGIEKGLVQLDFSFTANAGTSRLYFGRRGYYGGGTGWYYGSFVRPGFLLNIDGAVHKYVSVGGYIGFDASVGRTGYYGTGSYSPTLGVGFGARGVFHIYQLIADKSSNAKVDPGKLDFYAAVHLGGNLLFGKYILNDIHPFKRYFEELVVGETLLTAKHKVTLENIEAFAELSGDKFYAHEDSR